MHAPRTAHPLAGHPLADQPSEGRPPRRRHGARRLRHGWRRLAAMVATLGTAGGVTVGVAVGTPAGAPAAAAATTTPQIAVPAYIDPSAYPGMWTRLIDAAPGTVGLVVANVDNGPGTTVDPAWTSVLARAEAAGQRVVGYVNTGYLGTTGQATRLGSTAASDWMTQVEADVDTWYALYGPDLAGIFFDQVQNACGPSAGSDQWAGLYAELSAWVKAAHPGAVTVDNPGTPVPQCYQDSADVLVTFEGTYTTYIDDYPALSWTPANPSQIWHLVYGVPGVAAMQRVVSLSRSRGAGLVYATNGTLPDPYGQLPGTTYWTDEQAAVQP